jgi:hypothetical protein
VPGHVVADMLAALNDKAATATQDGTVGHRSIVAWQYRPAPTGEGGGGNFQEYDGAIRSRYGVALPIIANGRDMRAFLSVIGNYFAQALAQSPAQPPMLPATMPELDQLPDGPDETLR